VKGGFAFAGRGSGHGAGLCQWGAAGFAREGKGYREILAHYYPGTEIAVMY
jgi:stage II sporulation protein D